MARISNCEKGLSVKLDESQESVARQKEGTVELVVPGCVQKSALIHVRVGFASREYPKGTDTVCWKECPERRHCLTL